MEPLAGVFCAFWTPTGPEGEVLWEAFDRNLDLVLEAGVHGIMALGSTAEFPHFDLARRKAILERIAAACQKRGRSLIANVSHVNCGAAIELARHAAAQGAQIAAVLPPWFFPIEQRDLAEFFIRVGRESGLPLGLYNYPEVCGKRIELETIRTVASAVKVVAVKQSGGEFGYHPDLVELGRELGFSVLSGADTRLPEVLKLGCTGTVSGLANAVPEALCEILAKFERGQDTAEPARLLSRMAEEMKPLPFPLNVKAAIAARGVETGAPKNPISRETEIIYIEVVSRLRALLENHAD